VPLGLRLALLYVVLLTVGLAAFSTTVYLIASNRIYDGVDSTLSAWAGAVVATFQPLEAPLTETDIADNRPQLNDLTATGAIFRIRDANDRVLYASSRQFPGTPNPPADTGAANETFVTMEIKEQRLRVLYHPIRRNDQTLGSVEVIEPLKRADQALNDIRMVFIFGGLSALALTSVLAYGLATRALKPVREVSRLARDIQRTVNFSRRLPTPRGGGEMKELVSTFNAMIERVERTLLSQRAFLADSSHELRRPLAVLRTNIDVLNHPRLPDEERAACLQEMRGEAERMGHLLSDLLLLSRDEAQAIEQATVDYSALCKDAFTRRRAQDHRHDFTSQVANNVHVLGDKERLTQMLSNLLDNASRYTPEGGQVGLRLRRLDGIARVEIEDTGVGISTEDLPHVFERFYRGEQARVTHTEGAGLGLAIVKYIAEAHGGVVTVSSEPGRGSTFSVDLPTLP
jgi:two-component system, OmpR family, sensor kinase